MKPCTVHPYTVTARRQGTDPIRIGILAPTQADALLTAQELFPGHILGLAHLTAQWDEPA